MFVEDRTAPPANAPTIGAKPPPPLPKATTTIAAAPPPPPGPALEIEIARIHESPSNPRKRFPPEAELLELGNSILTHGLLQEVLVRPHPTIKGEFELVFGACRLRAAKLVKLKRIAAKCRDLTDVEVLEIQIIENSKRTDVHPLEEAEGYEQLHTKHGYDVDTIAAKVRKSRSYVYQRMKLLSLSPEARTSFYDGVLPATVAIYVARIPSKKHQSEAIKTIVQGYGGDPMSAREAAEHIQGKYMLKMVDAPFSTKDATLVPAAGACDTCPKRTKNAKDLFTDVKLDMCSDPDCFASKRDVDAKRRIAKAKEDGTEVLSVKVDPKGWDYGSSKVVALDQTCQADPKQRTYRELLKGAKVPTALAHGREGEIVEVMKREDVNAVLVKKHAFAKAEARREAARSTERDKFAAEHEVDVRTRKLANAELAQRVERRKPTTAFYLAVLVALEDHGLGDNVFDSLKRRELLSDEDAEEAMSIQEACEDLDEAVLRGLIAESLVSDLGPNRTDLLRAYDVDEGSFVKQAKAELKAEAKGEKS